MKGGALVDGLNNGAVVTVPDHDTPAQKRRGIFYFREQWLNMFDSKLGEEFIRVDGLVCRPWVDL